jgi:hypothetical protein
VRTSYRYDWCQGSRGQQRGEGGLPCLTGRRLTWLFVESVVGTSDKQHLEKFATKKHTVLQNDREECIGLVLDLIIVWVQNLMRRGCNGMLIG